MRVCFFASEKAREQELAKAFVEGLSAHGDTGVVKPTGWPTEVHRSFDAAAMVGVKSKVLFEECRRNGVTPIMLDKGYLRHRREDARTWEYWRVAVGAHHPTRYLMDVERPTDRLDSLEIEVEPWRDTGNHIVFAGSSAKYHAFYRLPDPTRYAKSVIRKIQRLTYRPIIYRPKPSWRDAVPIDRTRYSPGEQSLDAVLRGAYALVTHGSNACFEAVMAGVPSVVLGDAVAKPISSTELRGVLEPRMASKQERRQWFANLAYCQWTMGEFASGEAWATLRQRVHG